MQVTHGRLVARLLQPDDDLTEALALRHLAFRGAPGLDSDVYDGLCRHLVVHEGATLVACARLQDFAPGADLGQAYAAGFYDLAPLTLGRALELGRFCLHPGHPDPSILRAAFALITKLTDAEGIETLFGCSSLHGLSGHGPALAALRPFVASPSPARRAPETRALPDVAPDQTALPALLRFYLALGARVSDHAVVDRDLDTLHVLTLLPLTQVPPARARALRALASLPG